MMGVTMTMRKLKSQFVHVEIALAFALVLIGEISAGYSQGKGSQVAPKDAMYVKRPTAAPFAADGVPGIKQAKVRTIERH
jgi:hypothetical protein